MSTEKDRELNEQELWDLLQEPVETEMPKSERRASTKETSGEKTKTMITEKRKKALVWYLVGLFGIAFVVVLISLFLQGNPGNENTPGATADSTRIQELYDRIAELEEDNQALKNVVSALEEENTDLKNENTDLQVMMDGLNLMIDEMSNSLEYVEGNNLYSDENSEKLAKTMKAYQLLVTAQNAFIDYDEAVLESTMTELTGYLDLLTQDALNAYYMVIEYMEQPYLGQE